jgi:hypothetical protein
MGGSTEVTNGDRGTIIGLATKGALDQGQIVAASPLPGHAPAQRWQSLDVVPQSAATT